MAQPDDTDFRIIKWPESAVDQPTKLPAILLFGMPGVGKGTQGTLLGTMSGLFHVSTGAIFRGLDPTTPDGVLVHSYIDRGELVPDPESVRIWRNWMNQQIAGGRYSPDTEVLVLDGIPRSVGQCAALNAHVEVLAIVHLASPTDDPIVERLRRRALIEGRADDTDETIIRRRLEIYREKTHPVLHFYPDQLLHMVNPLGSPMEVNKRILDLIIPVIRTFRQAG